MSETIKQTIGNAVKDAMRARDKERLAVLRLLMSEFKRIEVDERIEVDDTRALSLLDKQAKQRRDSISQFEKADREDLASVERAELVIIQEFLPQALSEDEITTIVSDAITETSASGMQDMGKVMAIVKPQVQGRADMGQVSKVVKAQLAG